MTTGTDSPVAGQRPSVADSGECRFVQPWWQDLVGWGGAAINKLAYEQDWVDGTTSIQTYPEMASQRAWRVVASTIAQPICGLAHPERGGMCVMRPEHYEAPHVWCRDTNPKNVTAFILSLTMVSRVRATAW